MSSIKPRIFISYARADDEPFVRSIYADLTDRGIGVWWDKATMDSRGKTFLQEIRDAISDVERVILVVGPGAAESPYVKVEWEYALSICQMVTPLLRKGDYNLIPEPLKNIHCIDFRETRAYREALDELLRVLDASIEPLGNLLTVPELPGQFLERGRDMAAVRGMMLADINRPMVVTGKTKRSGVQGMGGIGKSVLAAAIARDCEVRRAFPDGVMWLTIGQEPLLTGLQAQLGEMLGDNARNFSNIEDGKRRLGTLLVDKRCLLVLDDVWELEQAEAFNVLGPRCRMLLTTRDEGLVKTLGASTYKLEVLGEAEALELLSKWAGQPAEQLPREAKAVAKECGYLPLALSMVGAMVSDHIPWGDVLEALQEADLEYIEAQFPDYPYPNILRAVKVSIDALSDDTCKRYQEMAVFPEDVSIPENVLVKFWEQTGKLKPRDGRKIIAELERKSLIRRDKEDGLALHDLQHDYIRKQAEDKRLELHQALLDAYNPTGKPWPEIPHDGYLYLHLAYHLKALGKNTELHQLLTGSPDWMRAKFAACKGDSAYMADLTLALQGYHEPPTPDSFLHFIELHTARQIVYARASRYTNQDLEIMVRLGRTTEALSHARLRGAEPERFEGLLHIYRMTRSLKQVMPELLQELLDTAHLIQRKYRIDEYLSQTIQVFLEELLYKKAETLTMGIMDVDRRSEALSAVATALAQAGEIERAREVFSQAETLTTGITDVDRRSGVLSAVATALAQAGEIERAREVFSQAETAALGIESADSRAEALSVVAMELAQAGEIERAREVFSQAETVALGIESADSRAEALSVVVMALAQAGEYDRGQAMAAGIGDTTLSAEALTTYANVMTEEGHFEEAQAIRAGIESARRRAEALSVVATALAQAGEYDRGQAIAMGITDVDRRAEALSVVATALAQAGEYDRGQAIATGIESARRRAEALSAVATALAQAGEIERAREVFSQAETAATRIRSTYMRAEVLSVVVMALAQAGEYDKGQAMAVGIESADRRAEALRIVATALAQAGEIERAREVFSQAETAALRIEFADRRAEALSVVAVALIQAGEYDKGQAIVAGIESADRRAKVVNIVAVALIQAGEYDKGQAIVTGIADAFWRDVALRDVAVALIQAGEYDKGQAMIAEIGDTANRRSEALSVVVMALAQAGEYDKGQAIAVEIVDADRRSEALSAVAVALIQAGEYDKGQAMAVGIEFARRRSEALSAVAVALIQAGEYDKGQAMAVGIESADRRAEALSAVAMVLAQAGEYDRGQAMAVGIEFADRRAEALSAVATALAQAGEIERAREVFSQAETAALGIKFADRRAEALSAVATALAQAGEIERARKVFSQAETAALGIKFADRRAEALSAVATALAQAGEIERARKVFSQAETAALGIEFAHRRAEALHDVAIALVKAKIIFSAISVLGLQEIAKYVQVLVILSNSLDQVAPQDSYTLWRQSFVSALRIICWERSTWKPAYDALTADLPQK